MKNNITANVLFNILVLLLTACGAPAPPASGDAFRVLASTSFLADIAQNVAGDRVKVESLLPPGTDPHAYQAAPVDVSRIAKSNVLILNGLDYELFIEPLVANAGGEHLIIEATTGLEAERIGDSVTADPHMWLDPKLVITYVENIRKGLSQADPKGAEVYRTNAEAYVAQLQALDAFIKLQVESIPAERRLLVTNHGSLGYFAKRYGFKVVDSILPGLSSEASASAREVAAAVDAVKRSNAPAIFLGEVENPDLANQIASETGVKVVDTLYLESLSEGAPAPTYIEMMKYDVTQIVNALK